MKKYFSPSRLETSVALGVLLTFASLVAPAAVSAQPVASCALSTADDALLGETFSGTLAIDNSGDAPGFVPAAELFLPPEVNLTSASVLGLGVAVEVVGTFAGGAPLTNPLTGESVRGPDGYRYVFLRLPLSSQTPAAPTLEASLRFAMTGSATVSTPFAVQASCLYAFGTDALNDAGLDTPVRSDDPSDAADQLAASTTPRVLILSRVDPAPTCTGASYGVNYTVSVDIATGATVDGLALIETLPDGFQITSAVASVGTVTSTLPITPGGGVDVSFGSLVGGAGVDATLTISGHVPQLDALAAPVLDPLSGAARVLGFSATASGGLYRGPGGDIPLDPRTELGSLSAHSVLIYETITNLAARAFRPGDAGEMQLEICVSDHFAFDPVDVVSVLPDGTTFTGSSIATSVMGADPTTVGASLGALGAGTTTTYTLDFDVDETYGGGATVYGGDVLPTTHDLAATVVGGATLATDEMESGADASVSIASTSFAKTLLLVNGGAAGGGPVVPGDVLTWQLQAVLASADQAALVITDYLPLPICDANTIDTTFGVDLRAGAGDTAGITPTVSLDAANNSLRFDYGAIAFPSTGTRTVELLIDCTVTDAPIEDGLVLTNLATSAADGTTSTTSATTLDPLTVAAPRLRATLGVSASSNGGAIFMPSSMASVPLDSLALAASPIQSDVGGVDAGDSLTFTVALENIGGHEAFDPSISLAIPVGLEVAAGGLNLTVTDGAGSPLTFGGGEAGGVISVALDDVLAAYDASSGSNIALITFDLEVANEDTANLDIDTEVTLGGYSSVDGGPSGFDSLYGVQSDTARTSTRSLSAATTLTGVAMGTVGDTTSFSLDVDVPEGLHTGVVLVETLPAELALVAGPVSLSLPAGLMATGSLDALVSGDGRTLTWNLGTVTNLESGASDDERMSASFDAVVLNVEATNDGDQPRASLSVSSGAGAQASANSARLTVDEPALNLELSASVPSADAGDSLSYSASISHTASSATTAHDLVVSFALPLGIEASGMLDTALCPGAFNASVTSGAVSFELASLAAAASCSVGFAASVRADASVDRTAQASAALTWTSQPGLPAALSTFNVDSLERDGSGTPSRNDYASASTADVFLRAATVGHALVGGADVVVGDYVEYDVTITVPEGVSAISARSLLPVGLAYVDASMFTASAGLSCDVGDCGAPSVVVSSAEDVRFDFGLVTNVDSDNGASETLTFRVRAVVTNVMSNTGGATLTANARVGSASMDASAITVREPALVVAPSVSPSVDVDAGDDVVVSVRLQSVGSAAAADAVVVVATGAELDPVMASFVAGTCPAAASVDLQADVSSFVFASLPPGTDCTFTFTVRPGDDLAASDTLTLGASASWSSLPGDVSASRTTHSAFGVERSGDVAAIGGVLNDYRVGPATTSLSSAGPGVAHALVAASSSSSLTAEPGLALGESATYDITLTFPEGTSSGVVVREDVPAGLRVISVTLDTSAFGGTVEIDPTNGALGLGSGDAATFVLGDVVNTGDNDTGNDTLVLHVMVEAILDPASALPVSSPPRASLQVDGVARGDASADLAFAMPQARLSLVVNDDTPLAESATHATLRVENLGSGPLCPRVPGPTDLALSLPTGFTVGDLLTDGVDNDGDGETDEADEVDLSVDATTLVLALPGCLGTGESASLEVDLQVAAGIADGAVELRGTFGSYSTLPAGAGAQLALEADLFDNDGDGATDESGDGEVRLTLDPAAPTLVFEKSLLDLDGAPIAAGHRLRFVISVRNTGSAPATNVVVTDVLPGDYATYDPATLQITRASATRAVDAGVLTVGLGTLGPAQVVGITFEVVVADPVPGGATVENQALLAADAGYGMRVSDDPSTPAIDDATIGVVVSDSCTDDSMCVGLTPVCDERSGFCVGCIDDHAGLDADDGCGDATRPLCRASVAGGPGTECVQCLGDDDCGAGDVCDPSTSLCVACLDSAPVGGMDVSCEADAPFCDTTVMGNRCVECFDSMECPGREVCSDEGLCAATDSDGDGVRDDVDLDDDNDGVPDTVELSGLFDGDPSADDDMDGIPAFLDPDVVICVDDDMDGACDATPTLDFDGDGIANHLDADADGDGLPDAVEGQDVDGDGAPDVSGVGFVDADMDGLAAVYDPDEGGRAAPVSDHDGDGSADYLDVDSDDDGSPDRHEAFDADGDGVPDRVPSGVDADGDGLDDAFDLDQGGLAAPRPDADRDGLADDLDLDRDGDGVPDTVECGDPRACPDADGDGIIDARDRDSDGDTIPDAVEGHDADGDGAPDFGPMMSDADGDGLDDAYDPDAEGGVPASLPDSDGDGVVDLQDGDDDGDGVGSRYECPDGVLCPDQDSDGRPDYLDVDVVASDLDGDGIPDADECGEATLDMCRDHDRDGLRDHLDADDDGDGVPTAIECGVQQSLCDTDGDGHPDHLDEDSDGDGIPDEIECPDPVDACRDTDGDGRPDRVDTDSDADGIGDVIEGHDVDGDGVAERSPSGMDLDGDGLDAAFDHDESGRDAPLPDHGGDGVPDYRDVDDDYDTIPTAVECPEPTACPDADVDGIPDHLDASPPIADNDGDGLPDRLECPAPGDPVGDPDGCPDTDGDGLPDFQDLDDDGDGIATSREVYDGDGDPRDDDTDGDGVPDYLDPDDDGDGAATASECADPSLCGDADMDGRPDYLDVCGDGRVSGFLGTTAWEQCDDGNREAGDGCSATCRLEAEALDTDMDGLIDVLECPAPGSSFRPSSCPDSDMDGNPDFDDPDDDGDGVSTANELGVGMRARDTDGDGMSDHLDPDDDDDGVLTSDELGEGGGADPRDSDGDAQFDFLDPDDDQDGLLTREELGMGTEPRDTDEDGSPDFLDEDDDDDTVPTRFEAADPDGDGSPSDARDTDMDGSGDWLDADDDGDEVLTAEEMPDPDGDGDPSDAVDTDDDGTPDYLDADSRPNAGGGYAGGSCAAGGSAPSLGLLLLLFALGRRRRRWEPDSSRV